MKEHHWLNIAVASIFIIALIQIPHFYLSKIDGIYVNKVIEFYSPMDEDGFYVIETNKEEYKVGETVYGEFYFCKWRNITPTVQWTLANHRYWPYVERRPTSGTVACWKDKPLEFPIEQLLSDTQPGEHHFNGILRYKVNPWNTLEFHIRTQPFNVIK